MTEQLRTPTIYFAHGKESGPWGTKISALAELARARGLRVESPDYSFTMDPDERVRHLLRTPDLGGNPLLLAGSSMGGYVSAVASRQLSPRGLFLMAPAVDIPGYAQDTSPGAHCVHVVHGWRDELIPPERVCGWAQRHKASLHLIDADHALNARLETMKQLFSLFLDEALVHD
ncbi:MAG: alpha/beta hydrolase [Ectothiorhodospiraceae bacterium]|nr:alpha/beta hydrolase [Ectothiorhodospiraceae bacterium]MCH8504421.1 alpha/beta hydrolase [Ectothiorhodospiraceae bacterium]